ncbi:MAG: Y-family DNA polymerase [bacterium]
MSKKAIALVDCDSFYASCEQLKKPQLIGKAVCVMSGNDGCVVARSKEAKQMGVKMGMPVFQAKKLFPDAIYISGNLGYYGEISTRVMGVLRDFSPTIETYSIDEAFVDLTGLRMLYKMSYLEMAKEIKKQVWQKIGIPVSVGISTTKTLAKLASEKAKKRDGVYQIGFRDITNELKNTEIIDIWGIGTNTASLLNKYYIYTANDFIKLDNELIKKIWGIKGIELKAELSGESVYPIIEKSPLPKSIQKTASFACFTNDFNYIKSSLNYHAHRACKKLRTSGLQAQVVEVMLRTKDFNILTSKKVLISATDWEFEIFSAINKLLPDLYKEGIIYRSSGITLNGLTSSGETQLSIFGDSEENLKNEKLAKIWDKIEHKFGRGKLTAGFTGNF